MVDLHWGMNTQMNPNTESADLLDIFIKEINKCQKYSIGMTFLVNQIKRAIKLYVELK